MKKLILFAMLISLGVSAEETQPVQQLDRVEKRQENQEKRIEQGEKSGQLTEREERRLERQQHNIEKAENRAEADGKVTRRERQKLERKQDRASREIYRKKHNERRHK